MKNIRLFLFIAALTGVVLLTASGCVLARLNTDYEKSEAYSRAEGEVAGRSGDGSPVVLMLWPENNSDMSRGTYWILGEDSRFNVSVPPGRYHLIAYEDRNFDGRYQDDEPLGIVTGDLVLDTVTGGPWTNLVVLLGFQEESILPPEIRGRGRDEAREIFEFRLNNIGMAANLDDSRFGAEVASEGYWTPLTFMEDYGVVLGFLEPYDPAKVPVLFVHGAKGYPQEFSELIDSLDREKFQPWIFSYPSGGRLETIGGYLNQALDELSIENDFTELVIVAHSMGGLVTRSMITEFVDDESYFQVPLYITISTPWNGHKAAAGGIKNSPAIIPSWYDMIPGNPLITGMFEKGLPETVNHHLFFSFTGKDSGSENADGSVTILSQLHMPAQDQARSITGIDAGHVGILSHPETLERVAGLLETAYP